MCRTRTCDGEPAVAAYLRDVLGSEPLLGQDEPDWADRPWPYKVYDGATRIALLAPMQRLGSLAADGTDQGPHGGAPWTLELLSSMLRYSYGMLERRLHVTANPTQYGQVPYAGARWSRGSAAGGGLYPCEIYWIAGPGRAVLPGIYHYAQPQHAMNRLALGDLTGQVGAAVPDEPAPDYLLVTVKLWQNSFKYADFSYHSVTMDVGCLLATWHRIAAAHGLELQPRLWFAETELDELLGLDPAAESVFAVVPLPGRTFRPPVREPRRRPSIEAVEVERSARVVRRPRLERVHREATLAERAPTPGALDRAAVALPEPDDSACALPAVGDRLDVDLTEVLRSRRSSFGRLAADPPLTAAEFGALLTATDRQPRPHPELRSPGVRTTRIVTVAQHVDGVAPGAYDYLPGRHLLHPLGLAPTALQRHYALTNYSLDQAAALLLIVARPEAYVEAGGPRGYRALNAEVGAVAQNVYLAAAAIGVGCGAALGFVNAGMGGELGLTGSDSWPLLLLLVGNERADEADVRYSLIEPFTPPEGRP